MKPLLTAFAAAAFFILSPVTSYAAYVIHLKDSTHFVTDQYFEDGDQIRFKGYGGLISIQRDLIADMDVMKEVRR
jgi:hypothetical protein